MKKLLFISILLYTNLTFSQEIKFESMDSVKKTKNQIYSDTKLFIAKTWKSANNVIQNDDKDAGIILVKGKNTQVVNFMLQTYIYTYSYMVTFKMKDEKFKITLDNINCESANFQNGTTTIIQPFNKEENCPETGTLQHPGISKKKAISMMQELLNELKIIVIQYDKEIKSGSSSDW